MNLGGAIHLNKTGIFVLLCVLGVLFLYSFSINGGREKNNENKINLRTLLEVSVQAAQSGGEQVVATKDNLKIESKGLTKEGMQDRVTNADFLSHCSMVNALQNRFPRLKVISEEAKKECEKTDKVGESNSFDSLPDDYVNVKDLTVWIDPLDATQEYTEKLYEYVTTMVCVAINGRPLIGVIYNPFTKQTSWAWVGKGTSQDLKNIEKSDEPTKIIISRSHSGQIKEVLKKGFKENYKLVIAGGAGYKALQVAKGKVDAYLHITAIKKWDICAGNAILDAVGGKMMTKLGKNIDYSADSDEVNEFGLIAVLKNDDSFVGKL